jgi:hypothetical protein
MWALLCLLQVLPGDSYFAAKGSAAEDDPDLSPEMLLVNAMQHEGPDRARLVEMLLQRGPPPLEATSSKLGETALSAAAWLGDAEVRKGVVQVALSNVWLHLPNRAF